MTDDYLNSSAEPAEGEMVVQVVGTRGSNVLEINLPSGEKSLAMLPTKFRKLIWVKRGDFLIVAGAAGEASVASGEDAKVRHMVQHILNKDNIKHLQLEGKWPTAFEVKETKKSYDDLMPPMSDDDEEDYDDEEEEEEVQEVDGAGNDIERGSKASSTTTAATTEGGAGAGSSSL